MTYSITYLRNKYARAADGKTFEEHEWSHIDDFQGWCASMHRKYPSEGFGTKEACDTARSYFVMDARPLFNMAATATTATRDGK